MAILAVSFELGSTLESGLNLMFTSTSVSNLTFDLMIFASLILDGLVINWDSLAYVNLPLAI